MSTGNDDRRLIAEALHLAQERYGRPVRGAKFKLLLCELRPGFDDRKLGFANLRSFLAQYPDVVAVPHDGYDIVPQPASNDTSAQPSTETGDSEQGAAVARLKIVRADVWRAFVLVDPATARYYDRETQRAVMIGLQEAQEEPETTRALRQLLASAPDRFVQITPVSSDEQLAVMHEFTSQLAHPDQRDALESALRQTLWFRAFNNALQGDIALSWKLRWADVVLAKIETWMQQNQVDVPNLVQRVMPRPTLPSKPTVPGPSTPPASQPGQRNDVDSPRLGGHKSQFGLRQRILNAVGRMPLSQLLQLPIPAEYYLLDE